MSTTQKTNTATRRVSQEKKKTPVFTVGHYSPKKETLWPRLGSSVGYSVVPLPKNVGLVLSQGIYKNQ